LEFPDPTDEFPVRGEKIPCSAHLREFGCKALKLRQKSAVFAHLREFDDNALK
jgi:hypothetical protein